MIYPFFGFASWAEQKVDPSLFPKELMAYASSFVEDVEVKIGMFFSVYS